MIGCLKRVFADVRLIRTVFAFNVFSAYMYMYIALN